MKVVHNLPRLPPVSVAGSAAGLGGMDARLPPGIAIPFSPTELLWRYGPINFAHSPHLPPSPLLDFKTHLPSSLASDPRLWSREDVAAFLRWAEREFDLPQFDMDVFQMNGKALSLLTKADLGERCPGAGDVLHNVLAMLAREYNQVQRCLVPGSPVTPTRPTAAYPLSPHSHPPTPTWSLDSPYAANIASLMAGANSVTLSPAPSLDSQAGSPGHSGPQDHQASTTTTSTSATAPQQLPHHHHPHHHHHHHQHQHNNPTTSTHSSSSSGSINLLYKSDSDEDNPPGGSSSSPPSTPTALTAQRLSEVCVKDQPSPTLPPHQMLTPLTPGAFSRPTSAGPGQGARESFFFNDTPEPNTNGRLLWDFLQQLLNDPSQRYTQYISWKCRETGVFKIVDPPGLAKLWGIQKNHLSMNYDKMSRALRYYYRVNILRKVQGERHCYQFLRNPTELKSIKNISLLRQQNMRIKSEPEEECAASSSSGSNNLEPESDMPTDLSMASMSQSNSSYHSAQAEQPQPLSLHDPPLKYRSHAYSLHKTNQEVKSEDRKWSECPESTQQS